MMAICPVCSKRTCIHWPEHWVYRRGETFYCSEQCMDVDMVRDMNLMKQVRMERRKRKMARYKKDGTPAKKPGPRAKKPEIPEPVSGGEWEKMETPEQLPPVKLTGPIKIETPEKPITKPLVYDGYTVCCIESKTFGRFYWDRDHNHMDWTTAEGEEVSFTPNGWKMFLEEVPKVAAILGVEL